MVYPLGSGTSSLQLFDPQPVTIVFCNMDNLARMKVRRAMSPAREARLNSKTEMNSDPA